MIALKSEAEIYDEYCFILLNSVSILALNDPIIKTTFSTFVSPEYDSTWNHKKTQH